MNHPSTPMRWPRRFLVAVVAVPMLLGANAATPAPPLPEPLSLAPQMARASIPVQLLERLAEEGSVVDAAVMPFENVAVDGATFPALDAHGEPAGSARWRIVRGTGNGGENYLASTPDGKLLDFGGPWLRISEDAGLTWETVVPTGPLNDYISSAIGEGSVAFAPDGDILGVTWPNTLSGDFVITFKYEADTEKWQFAVQSLHQPAFDRPGLSVVPGPFEIAGQRYEYVSILRGGIGGVKPAFYSFDGLNYDVPTNRSVTSVASKVSGEPLEVERWPMLDWLQPHEQTGITPLGRGRAMWSRASITMRDEVVRQSVIDPATLTWSGYEFPNNWPPPPTPEEVILGTDTRMLADSKGNLHHVDVVDEGSAIEYSLSHDGGASWLRKRFPVPDGFIAHRYFKSLRVNGALGVAALALHTTIEESDLDNRDFVYRFSYDKDVRLDRIYELGAGSFSANAGLVDPNDPDRPPADGRFDFPTVALLPDGRIAVSFVDETSVYPAIAIEPLPKERLRSPTRRPRTLSFDYVANAEGVQSPGFGYFVVATSVEDKEVTLTIDDAAGGPASYYVRQGDDGTGGCGPLDEPIPIKGGKPLEIFIWASPAQCGMVNSTTGTVEVTLR